MNVGYTKLTQTKAILKALQDKGVRPVHRDAQEFRQKVRKHKFNNMRTRHMKQKEIDKKALIQQVIEIKTRNARNSRKARKAIKTARKTMAIRDSKKKDKKYKLQSLRTSLENYKVILPTPRALSKPLEVGRATTQALSRKTGSNRLISALVSNRFKQQMNSRATSRATRRAKTI